jgi:hypothetical protein
MAEVPDLGSLADLRWLVDNRGWVRPVGHGLVSPSLYLAVCG